MTITPEVFEASLHCRTKCYLVAHSTDFGPRPPPGPGSADEAEAYRREAVSRISASVPPAEVFVGMPPLSALKRRHYEALFDCQLAAPGLETQIHCLRLTRDKRTASGDYTPLRFLSREKVTAADKMRLAYDAYVYSQVAATKPRTGEIIHGRELGTLKVPLAPLNSRVRAAVQKLSMELAEPAAPAPVLNKHCAECPFAARCVPIAKERDDLSLLPRMSEKERLRLHERGIFTVTQLSHTFRHRRRQVKKHDHALKALAIRKNQIHVIGPVALPTGGTPVYIDVEGDPDRDFYYCIGIRYQTDGTTVQRSYWANDPSEEGAMWAECVAALRSIDDARLVHYGSFETSFLRQMKKRYAESNPALLSRLMESAVNLLAIVYTQVYFPTYSNGLKEIAQYLGFSWSEPAASGFNALQWRRQWEASRELALKQRLITYNAEDCAAAEVVARALASISVPGASVVDAASVKREYPQRFGKNDFALPEFEQINEAAQWDYQHERVHLRAVKRSVRRRTKGTARSYGRSVRVVSVAEDRPTACIYCRSAEIKRHGRLVRVVHDLRLSKSGIRRWVVRYAIPRYACWRCGRTFHLFTIEPGKYGPTIRAYVTYQVIELKLSQRAVSRSLVQIFNIPVSAETVNRLKVDEAARYERTYRALLEKIVRGPVVHADETRAKIQGKQGYVWVFANSEEVIFTFSENREASTPLKVLSGFTGVLVSDFYAAYDSIPCPQQKCLIHLMRDINEDLCKQPFNEEMKQIARGFAGLLQPIIESVDKFGLKARHLRKHQADVTRFYKTLSKSTFQTDVAVGYQRRFEKNRDRLFTFLNHDGVPWNNNNAEHAIKAFVRLRNVVGGTSTEKGLHEYLVLLSISETCKNKGVRFLDFLLSGESDVDRFVQSARRRRRAAHA